MIRRFLRRTFLWMLRLGGHTFRPLETFQDAPDMFQAYWDWTRDPRLKRKPGGWEYLGRFYPDYLTVGGASYTIHREALKYCRGTGLDIGAGLWPLPGAVAVDVWRGPGAGRTLRDFADGTQDFVFSSHCLEHVTEWQAELQRWVLKVRTGGIIFLYLPHPDCGIWQPGSPMVWDEHKWQPTPAIIKQALTSLECSIVSADDGPDSMMSFHVVARRN